MRWTEIMEADDRKKGPSLRDQKWSDPVTKSRDHADIYRAVPVTVNSFKSMDYVTMSRKFAIEHAHHMAETTGEDHHVLKAMVKTDQVFSAYNPGEYFYDGPDKVGRPILGRGLATFIAKPTED